MRTIAAVIGHALLASLLACDPSTTVVVDAADDADGGGYPRDAAIDAALIDAALIDAALPASVKWHPGIYAKLEDWQLQSPTQMSVVYDELRETPQLRGIRVTVLWGRYETRAPGTGVSTYDFSQLDDILAALGELGDKHLILSISWREFKSELGASNILPNDLRGGTLWSDDPQWEHVDFDHLWAYRMAAPDAQPGSHGYNLKLWDVTVLARLEAFLEALGAHLGDHPNLTVVSTTESAIGAPVIPFVAGEGEAAQYAGQLRIIRKLHQAFPACLTIPDLNFSREHVADVVAIMESEGIGLGSSNSNLAAGINRTDPPPGVLTYYPQLSGKVALAPEIQGDDYRHSNSDDSGPDYPSYEQLYLRVRDDLQANYTVMQRNVPFWWGNATTPSMLEFIQTYPAIVDDVTGAGGLDTQQPSNL